MNTTRNVLVALCTGALSTSVFLFAGCGDDSDTPTTDASADVVLPPTDGAVTDVRVDAPPDANKPLGPIDRMGRPAISSFLVSKAKKDAYNHEETFSAWLKSDYDTDFDTNLFKRDALDGQQDWGSPDAGAHFLREPLKLDTLLIDTSKPAAVHGTYLSVEKYVLYGLPINDYGGRPLDSDVVDISLKLLVCGPVRSSTPFACPLGDGVDKATKDPTTTFPYLAPPN